MEPHPEKMPQGAMASVPGAIPPFRRGPSSQPTCTWHWPGRWAPRQGNGPITLVSGTLVINSYFSGLKAVPLHCGAEATGCIGKHVQNFEKLGVLGVSPLPIGAPVSVTCLQSCQGVTPRVSHSDFLGSLKFSSLPPSTLVVLQEFSGHCEELRSPRKAV